MEIKTLDIVYCGVFATITAILSQVSIPMPAGVPLTLQTFAISLAGIILGSKRGFVSILVYVLIGTIGLPVFSGFSGGIGTIVGPTGGFILSFPIMSFIIGLVCKKTDNKILIFLGIMLASIPNYLMGMLQFSLVTGSTFYNSFLVSVLPFILVDIIKMVLATIIGSMVMSNKSMRRIIRYDKA